ncbi:hypothetical protein L7F22_032988 [Adiantum nelumboides]|nr:hypothetical protein [Adiantum nelumboides]
MAFCCTEAICHCSGDGILLHRLNRYNNSSMHGRGLTTGPCSLSRCSYNRRQARLWPSTRWGAKRHMAEAITFQESRFDFRRIHDASSPCTLSDTAAKLGGIKIISDGASGTVDILQLCCLYWMLKPGGHRGARCTVLLTILAWTLLKPGRHAGTHQLQYAAEPS